APFTGETRAAYRLPSGDSPGNHYRRRRGPNAQSCGSRFNQPVERRVRSAAPTACLIMFRSIPPAWAFLSAALLSGGLTYLLVRWSIRLRLVAQPRADQ